jgi:enoyl-CoA hydratase/carnithine racemase
MSPHAQRTESDGIVTVTFTRDEKLNAVSTAMIEALRGAVTDLAERDDLKVLVVTGEGRYFTAGLDLGAMGEVGGSGQERQPTFRRRYRRLHLLFDEMEAVEKPIVLAANGPCLGIGVEMGSSVDFRLCAEHAVFGLPEVPNLGFIPGSGGISRFTRLVGPHWARYVVMAGKNIDAETARTIGFVHEIYPAEGFADRVHAFARDLAALPGEAVGVAKLAIDAAASVDRVTARDFDRVASTMLLLSEDYQAKVAALAARKKT